MLQIIPFSLRRKLNIWLLLCLSMVALMVWIGGLTRLTESGLSMVEWKPLHILPPMNTAQWQEEFSKYQQFPEYQRVNRGMELGEFQHIFWLEYIHRLLGRSVGLVFFLPLLGFALTRKVPRRFLFSLLGIFALGGVQGAIGWIMVSSGLQDNPWVSPVKLALHLGTAFIIFALIFWQYLRLRAVEKVSSAQDIPRCLMPATQATGALLFLQIFLGALVAGRDAGMIYNTYPTMDGVWIPDDLLTLHPLWRNVVENITTIQFDHRVVAHLLALAVIALAVQLYRKAPALRSGLALRLLFPVLLVQFLLGISTLLWQVPIPLASAHQMGALALWAVLVGLLFHLQQLRNARNALPTLAFKDDNRA